ncbi:MAG: glycosyltransferase family 2 protein [Pseudarcicella sp.]|nr:glycosyltransferase family 2 protein [Pseudarcicella sp.]MBP6411118.1 glycosyltransferase family 2 protein [Pseudarcicella sp.]
MDIAVVILNYNGQGFLDKFLPSVITNSLNAQVIVADNASKDNSLALLMDKFPTVKIIQNTENYGFAGGYNHALKQVKAKYYVLLNSDVEVSPNWLKPMYDLLENNKNIAACQPKILAFHQPEDFEYAGAGGGFIDTLGYPFCRGRIFDTVEKDLNQYNDAQSVFWATGACLFIRSEVFHSLKGFDEDFFAHMEEIDLCWRIHSQGHEVYVCPQSIVYHVGGGTLQKSNPFKTFLNFRNGLAMIYKNLPEKQLRRKIFIRLVLDGLAGVKFLLSGDYKSTIAIIKAHFSFYGNFKHWNTKRKNNLKSEHIITIYPKSIVVEYYLKKKKIFADLGFKNPKQ